MPALCSGRIFRLSSLLLPALTCAAQSPAPALPSRGLLPELRAPEAGSLVRVSLTPLSGYDGGLAAAANHPGGPFQELDAGLAARRDGRRASLLFDYHLGLRHYSSQPRLDYSTQGLYLDTRVRVSRRWTFRIRDLGTSSTLGDASRLPAPPVPAAFYAEGGPEVFHSRTVANTALADLIFTPSARTSVSFGGDGFLVERQNRGLADAAGWRARADLAYRYHRRRTVTLSYAFTRFQHTRRFGDAGYAVYALGHSARLSRRSEVDLLAGLGLLRGAEVRPVELDAEIARLLGTARGAEVFRLRSLHPHLLLGWSQLLSRSAVRFELARFVSDGGGLSGLARQNYASLSVVHPLSRDSVLGAEFALRTYRSLDAVLYNSVTAASGFRLSRRLNSRMDAVARYHYSFYHFDRGLLRWSHRHQLSAGLCFRLFEPPAR